MAKKRKRRKKIILPKVQTAFCLISAVFILGCAIYYGTRLIKYYKIYNPKNETGEVMLNLAASIISDSEIVSDQDGLHLINGNYVYKGKKVNNYILVDNILFRILRINKDKTIDIVMDDYINKISWNDEITTYEKSNIYKYLNDKVLKIFNKDNLTKTSYCVDRVYELSEVNCENVNNDTYIRLLGINDYLNSINDDQTFIERENVWLYNHGKNNAWHTTTYYISNSKPNNIFGVLPVITLKNSITYLRGDGSINNPYIIEDNDNFVKEGTYLDIHNNIYIVYEVGKDYYKVESNKVLKEKKIFDTTSTNYEESALKTYLEKTYLESLNFKDILKTVDFNGYESKIGLLSEDDFKFNSSLNNYYLSDYHDKTVSVYNGMVLKSEPNTKRNIRIALGIKKDLNFISGNGSKYAPLIVEE